MRVVCSRRAAARALRARLTCLLPPPPSAAPPLLPLRARRPAQEVAGTLEELWLSYNAVSSLEGLAACSRLRVLYLSNNALREWAEVERLAELPALRELLLVGNPLYEGAERAASRAAVLRRLRGLAKLDNELVLEAEREAASAAAAAAAAAAPSSAGSPATAAAAATAKA